VHAAPTAAPARSPAHRTIRAIDGTSSIAEEDSPTLGNTAAAAELPNVRIPRLDSQFTAQGTLNARDISVSRRAPVTTAAAARGGPSQSASPLASARSEIHIAPPPVPDSIGGPAGAP
jgi:hypothetical protein